MADIGKVIKGALIKSMEAIGTAANNIASNTKVKMDEMTIINRRREILGDFGAKAYELWQKGVSFPDELEEQLRELSDLDVRLNELRIQKLSNVENETAGKTLEAEKDTPVIRVMPTEDAEPAPENEVKAQGTVQVVPLSDAINDLFNASEATEVQPEEVPAEQPVTVNDALDNLGESLQEFSNGLSEQIGEMTAQLWGEDEKTE